MVVARATIRVRLTPFQRGAIYGLFLAGFTYREIAEEIVKADGSSPSQQRVASTVAQARANGGLE